MAVACSALLSACAGSLPPVPVIASSSDMGGLAGKWDGTYEMLSGSRRTGSILFELQAGRDTAVGTVVMTFNQTEAMPGSIQEHHNRVRMMRSEALSISFVRLSHARLTGELEPYIDPYCGCTLRTTFTGSLRGDRIEGTFLTVHLDSRIEDQGKWSVTRQK
jgi:hypothetical protein